MNLNIITEPVTTLIEEEKYLRIISNLPDINEEKIRIDLENNISLVTITASDINVIYEKKIIIPCDARFLRKQFYDGVLEITLEKMPNISDIFPNTPST
jgi:HSP20 family molecular chaperone IbpA